MERVCAGPGCEATFEPSVWNQIYHSLGCKRNAERKRAYEEDISSLVERELFSMEPTSSPHEESQADFLRKEVTRLGRLADKYKAQTIELVDSVYKAAGEAFSEVQLPTPRRITRAQGSGDEEVAVAVMADWQLGKVTPSYNSDICRQRIRKYAEKAIRITNTLRADHPINHLRMWFLGDLIEGEDIFPGQSHLIDSSLYRQVGVNGPEIIGELILTLLQEFDTIHFIGVEGNHGNIGGLNRRQYNKETNMDRLLYRIVSHMFAYEPRVTFDIPDGDAESNFYFVDKIGTYSTLLVHGHQFPQPNANHAYYKKVMGWKDCGIPEKFNDVYMGHYHTSTKMTLGSTVLRISPSPESSNTFAQEVLGVQGRPAQNLQFVHPDHGLTSEWPIWVD